MERLSRNSSYLDRSRVNTWRGCGGECPSGEVVFFAQVLLIFIVVIAAVVNLAMDTGKTEFWAGIMSACLGYILPSPSITFKKKLDFGEDTTDGLIIKNIKNQEEEEEAEEEEEEEKHHNDGGFRI